MGEDYIMSEENKNDKTMEEFEYLCDQLTARYKDLEIDKKGLRTLYEDGKIGEFHSTLQEICNWIYENYTFTPELLDFQVFINILGNEYDLIYEKDIVNTDNGEAFVQ